MLYPGPIFQARKFGRKITSRMTGRINAANPPFRSLRHLSHEMLTLATRHKEANSDPSVSRMTEPRRRGRVLNERTSWLIARRSR